MLHLRGCHGGLTLQPLQSELHPVHRLLRAVSLLISCLGLHRIRALSTKYITILRQHAAQMPTQGVNNMAACQTCHWWLCTRLQSVSSG